MAILATYKKLGLKPTAKPKGQFEREYNQIRNRLINSGEFKSTDRNLNKTILTEMGEYPNWEGEVYKMSQGVARPESKRDASNLKSNLKRDEILKEADELMTAAGFESEVVEGKKLFKNQPRTGGKALDHVYETQEFGFDYNRLKERFAAGVIDEYQFKKELNEIVSKKPGNITSNLKLETEADNYSKMNRTRAVIKDKKLLDKYSVQTADYTKKMAAFTAGLNKTNQLSGIHAFAKQQLMAQTQNYDATYIPKNGNGSNGNGSNGNGNGVNGKNGNGVAVNGKNGKNGFLKGMENVNNYSGLGKLRDADQLANIGVNVSTGNYGGAAIGAATYGTSKALQDPKVQARVARQITQLVAERGAKSAAKFLPGLDVVLSGKESWDYLKRGRWDQAGIAALSGAIGWIPLIGDGASAALDLSNTGIDIARLQAPTGTNKKKSQNKLTRFLKGLNS